MGAPLPGFVSADDREDDQLKLVGEGWLESVETLLMDRFGMKAGVRTSSMYQLKFKPGRRMRQVCTGTLLHYATMSKPS